MSCKCQSSAAAIFLSNSMLVIHKHFDIAVYTDPVVVNDESDFNDALYRNRLESHTSEQMVKMALAADAKQDMFYGIEKVYDGKDSDDDAEAAVGKKRKHGQLQRVMEQESDSDDDEEDYSNAEGTARALQNKRAKRDA